MKASVAKLEKQVKELEERNQKMRDWIEKGSEHAGHLYPPEYFHPKGWPTTVVNGVEYFHKDGKFYDLEWNRVEKLK